MAEQVVEGALPAELELGDLELRLGLVELVQVWVVVPVGCAHAAAEGQAKDEEKR